VGDAVASSKRSGKSTGLSVLAQSRDRVAKERAIRRRQLKRLWARLKQLSTLNRRLMGDHIVFLLYQKGKDSRIFRA
jgi:hypothetical protein